MWGRKPRVVLHMVNDDLPSVEGILLARRPREYVIGVPKLLMAVGGNPTELASRQLVVPRENVAFYEVL